MMIKPSINRLMRKVDSKYTLVVQTAKRARQLADGEPALVHTNSKKPVTIAVNEIDADKVRYTKPLI